MPIKPPQGLGRTPRVLSALPKLEFTGPCLEHVAPPPAKPPEPRPPRPAHSSHFQATPAARLAFPKAREAPRTQQSLAGDPESPSPDSPVNVVRVSLCAILKFLPQTVSTPPSRASRANQLDYRAVSRPKSSPPMSSSACACGSTYSDHRRRRSAHRRDRQDLPYTLDHFTGAVSPPVSPSALFLRRVHCSIRGRITGSFLQKPGGFLHRHRLM
jgi:hypothetical protein